MPVCQHIETRSDSKIRCSSVVKNCQVKSGRPALLSLVPMHRRGGRQLAVAVMRAVSCRSLSCAPCCRQTMRRTRNIDSERDYTGAHAEPPGNGERRAAGAYRLPVPWGARRHGGRRGQQLGRARVIPGGMSAAVLRVPLQRSPAAAQYLSPVAGVAIVWCVCADGPPARHNSSGKPICALPVYRNQHQTSDYPNARLVEASTFLRILVTVLAAETRCITAHTCMYTREHT